MTRYSRHFTPGRWQRGIAAVGLAAIAACTADVLVQEGNSPDAPEGVFQMAPPQGELYGWIYSGTSRVTSANNNYAVELAPVDPQVITALSGMGITFAGGFDVHAGATGAGDFQWFDVIGGDGGCDPAARGPELHGGSGLEGHCVLPGVYSISFSDHDFLLDYVGNHRVGGQEWVYWHPSSTRSTHLADESFSRSSSAYSASDQVLYFNVGTHASGVTVNGLTEIDLARSNLFTSDWAPTGAQAASLTDWLRVDVGTSSTNWPGPGQPATSSVPLLHRVYWDYGAANGPRTNWFWSDAGSWNHTRNHRYADDGGTARCVLIAHEVADPNSYPADMYSPSTSLTGIPIGLGGADCATAQPNLVPATITAPASATAGSSISATVSVTNNGQRTASGRRVEVYFNTTPNLSGTPTLLGSFDMGGISAGTTLTGPSLPLTLPGGISGTRYLVAKVDALGEITESNEGDNIGAATAINLIAGMPDFSVTSVTSAASFGQGAAGTVSVNVTNGGTAAGPPSTTTVYLSADQVLGAGDIPIGTLTDSTNLSVSTSRNEGVSVTIPASQAPGTYYLIGKVDATASVQETNEGNNTGTRVGAVTVLAMPDFVIDSVIRSGGTVSRSSPGTAFVYYRNAGAVRNNTIAGAQTRLYLSTDSSWDASDVQVSSATLGSPLLGRSTSEKMYLTIPTSLSNGAYYLIAYVDATGVIPESTEGNNTGARVGQVTLVSP